MKTFEEILNSGAININELENYRLEQIAVVNEKTKKTAIRISIGSSIICLISIFIVGFIGIPIIIFIAVMAIFTSKNFYKSNFEKTVHESIIKKMLQSIDKSFDYKPDEWIPEEEFSASNFLPKSSNYRGQDYFYGTFENIPVKISQISASKSFQQRVICYLEGIFITVEFKQNFAGRTTVIPQKIAKEMTNALGKNMYQSRDIRDDFRLTFYDVDAEFEKNFGTFTTNPDEAKNKILKPNLRNYLNQLAKQSERSVYFSFSGQKFFIGLNNSADIFKISINNQINEENIKKYYIEILTILNYIENIYSFIEENLSFENNLQFE